MFDPYGEEPDAPKEVSQIRRLLDGLIYEDHEQAIEVLDRLMAQDDYGKRICKQIIFPKNAVQANLNIYAFTINANTQNIQTEILSSLSFSLEKKKDIPAQDWIFDIPKVLFGQ